MTTTTQTRRDELAEIAGRIMLEARRLRAMLEGESGSRRGPEWRSLDAATANVEQAAVAIRGLTVPSRATERALHFPLFSREQLAGWPTSPMRSTAGASEQPGSVGDETCAHCASQMPAGGPCSRCDVL